MFKIFTKKKQNKEEIEKLTNKIQSLDNEMVEHHKMLFEDIHILLDKENHDIADIFNARMDLIARYYRIIEIGDERGYFRGKIECLRRG